MLHTLVIILRKTTKGFLQIFGTSATYIGFICDAELLPER